MFFKRRHEPIVDFIVAGTQKGGTTALDAYLRTHPRISMASKKEVHFFDNEENFRGRPSYRKYHKYFDSQLDGKVVGESTPAYMYWHDAPRRMWEYNSNLKIIVVLRNPIERAYSHWNMERDRGNEPLSFLDAIQQEEERCRTNLPFQNHDYSYTDRGFFSEQLRRLWRFFPREQTLAMKNEELRSEPNRILAEVSEFLDIPDFPEIKAEDIHSRPYVSNMTDQEHQLLIKKYQFEIRELEQLLEWDCAEWLTV